MSNRDHTRETPAGQADSGSKLVELRGHEARLRALRERRIDLEVERIVATSELRTTRTEAGAEIPGAAACRVIDALDRLRSLESARTALLASAGNDDDAREDLLKRLQAGAGALGAWLDADRAPAEGRGMRIARLGLLLACLATVALAATVHLAFLVLLVPVGGAMSFLLWTGQDRTWRRMGARRRFESLRLELPSTWTENAVRMRLRSLSLAAEGLRRRETLGGGEESPVVAPDDLEIARSELRTALAEAGLHGDSLGDSVGDSVDESVGDSAGDSVDESTESRLRAAARAWRADRALRGVAADMSGERAAADAIRASIDRDLSRAGAAPPDADASVRALAAGTDGVRRQ